MSQLASRCWTGGGAGLPNEMRDWERDLELPMTWMQGIWERKNVRRWIQHQLILDWNRLLGGRGSRHGIRSLGYS